MISRESLNQGKAQKNKGHALFCGAAFHAIAESVAQQSPAKGN
jgi:hypothetical protein